MSAGVRGLSVDETVRLWLVFGGHGSPVLEETVARSGGIAEGPLGNDREIGQQRLDGDGG